MLALFSALFVLLRIRWSRLPQRFRRLLFVVAIASIALMAFAFVTRISTTRDHLNFAVYWCAVLGYIFFVILCTRLRPIWLTSLIAIVLILPLLSASALLPLAAIFSHQSHHIQSIGDNLVSDLVPNDAVTDGASGADITIYRRASWCPFLHQRKDRAYALLQHPVRHLRRLCHPAARSPHLLMICPALPGHLPEDGRSLIVKLY